jgi:hypothetical protein
MKLPLFKKILKNFISNKKFDVVILLFHVVNFLKKKNELEILASKLLQKFKKKWNYNF